MNKFVSVYQPVTSPSFYTAINTNKNLEMYKVTDQYLQKYANSACKSKEWDSLPFQEFVKVFMGENTPYNSILITWGTGVGKTCGAVQITEALRSAVQMFNKSIYIIAPANLQQNYKETLLSECSGNRIPKNIDPKLRENYISKTYRFYSYIKFGKLVEAIVEQSVKNGQNPREALLKKFSNCVFVIDEAHNLNNLKEDEETKEELKGDIKVKRGRKKTQSEPDDEDNTAERRLLNTLELLFRSIKNSKLILLTATPIRNHLSEIVSLMNLLRLNNGQEVINEQIAFGNGTINMHYLLNQIKGYVSYVRGNSQISFPRIDNAGEVIAQYPPLDPEGKQLNYKMHLTKVIPCEMTFYQLAFYLWYCLPRSSTGRSGDMFGTNLGIISDVALPLFSSLGFIDPKNVTKATELANILPRNAKTDRNELTDEGCLYGEGESAETVPKDQSFFLCKRWLPYFATKFDKLLDNLLQEGVHYVYSRFVSFGTNLISVACQLYGWDCIKVNTNNEITYRYSITPNNNIVRRCWCGQLEPVHSGDHPFSQGHIILYTGETNANQKILQNLLAIVNSENNKRGELCKVFIGSRVSGEGVNYRRLRYVHIMEPWWNNTVLQQVIGRAARNCSHFDLPRDQQNVIVYRYASVFPSSLNSITEIFPQFVGSEPLLQQIIDRRETADMMIYRIAESKDLEIAQLTRLLKTTAVDCENNYIWNRVWTEAEIQQLRQTHQFVKNGKVYKVNDAAIKLLNVGENGSPECEYLDCDYDCVSDQPLANPTDDTVLYSYINVNKQKIVVKINQIIEFIQSLHTPMFSLEQLLEYFNVNVQQTTGYTKFDYYNIFDAITEMLTNQNIVFEWQGMSGRLILYETPQGVLYMFDAFAKYIDDPTLIPQYFKFNNVFTNGSNIRINMTLVDAPTVEEQDHTDEIIRYINQANTIIQHETRDIARNVKICELFDNMNDKLYSDVMLTPFNLMVEYLIDHPEYQDNYLQQFVNWYLVENYRTNETGLDNFYISWTNIKGGNQDKIQDENGSILTVYDWIVEFYCRYKVNGNWEYFKIIYNVNSSVDPFVALNFSSLNFNYVVQRKKLSDVYYTVGEHEDAEYIREYIGSILTEVLTSYNDTGIKNANKQAANVYEYFAATLFTDGYNVRIVNASRGNFKQDNKIDKRSISTGQDCTTTTKTSLTRSLQQVRGVPEIDQIVAEINSSKKVYLNSRERCKTIEYTFRQLDLERRDGMRWFYMYGNYDFFNYHI